MIVRTVEIVRPSGPGKGRSAAYHGVRDRDPEPLAGLREAVVLAVVAVALGVREDEHAIGGEGGQRVLERDGRLALSGVADCVDAGLLEPLDRLLLRGVRLGPSRPHA